ncbi:MAG: GTP 3',8-cyclase MoaA [Promethearchaeota archaeon]
MLKDPWNRPTTHIRISVNNNCNLHCPYCHQEGHKAEERILSLEEIKEIILIAVQHGISKVKITGGEPLLRDDIIEIIQTIADIEGIEEIAMTTNGTRLKDFATKLRSAGLNRINIGCDAITSSILDKNLTLIQPGLISAKDAGFKEIKLNMVVLKGLNDHQIDEMIDFARQEQVTLQLIELLDVHPHFYSQYHVNLDSIEETLAARANKIVVRSLQSRKRYHLNGVVVEVVRAHSPEFCKHCTKIRVTSDAFFKPCLRRDDNLIPIQKGRIDECLREAIKLRAPYVQEKSS